MSNEQLFQQVRFLLQRNLTADEHKFLSLASQALRQEKTPQPRCRRLENPGSIESQSRSITIHPNRNSQRAAGKARFLPGPPHFPPTAFRHGQLRLVP